MQVEKGTSTLMAMKEVCHYLFCLDVSSIRMAEFGKRMCTIKQLLSVGTFSWHCDHHPCFEKVTSFLPERFFESRSEIM